jgi:hypothetical protein
MSKKIDLGRKAQDLVSILGPDDGAAMYPHLHISDHDDPRLHDMPDEGEARIRYKVKAREHREDQDAKGKKKHRYSVTLAVHHIEPPDKPAKKPSSNGLDEARASAKDYFDKIK